MTDEAAYHCPQCGQTVRWGINACTSCRAKIVRGFSESIDTALGITAFLFFLALLAALAVYTSALWQLSVPCYAFSWLSKYRGRGSTRRTRTSLSVTLLEDSRCVCRFPLISGMIPRQRQVKCRRF